MYLSELHFKPIITNLCMEKVSIKNWMTVLNLVADLIQLIPLNNFF